MSFEESLIRLRMSLMLLFWPPWW